MSTPTNVVSQTTILLPSIVANATNTVNNVINTSVSFGQPVGGSTSIVIVVASRGGSVIQVTDTQNNTYTQDAAIAVDNTATNTNDFIVLNVWHAENINGGNSLIINILFDQTVQAACINALNIANNAPFSQASLNITYNTTNTVSVSEDISDEETLVIGIAASTVNPVSFSNLTQYNTLTDPNSLIDLTIANTSNPAIGTFTANGSISGTGIVWIAGILEIQPLIVTNVLGNLGTVPTINNEIQSQISLHVPGLNGPSTALTSTPHIAPTLFRRVDQTGASSAYSCASRALKNAKAIQLLSVNNQLPFGFNPAFILPSIEPAAGFFSILDLAGPSNVNRIQLETGFGIDLFATVEKGTIIQSSKQFAPVFNGTIHIFQITYNNGTQTFQVATADMLTIQNFLIKAAPVIQDYTSQYGNTGIKIDGTIYQYTFNISGNSFNDQDLAGTSTSQGLIDTIAQQFGFLNDLGDCILIVGAPGVTNNTANPAQGVLGYHSASSANNIPYIYFGLTSGGLTPHDSADKYQLVASHETAEMTVDPGANLANPEVCDPCGPNCDPVWRDFFDSTGKYLFSSAFFPPLQSYDFFINAIIQAQYAGPNNDLCMTPPFACAYAPPGTSPSFPFIPGVPQLPFPLLPNEMQILLPGGVDSGKLVSTPIAGVKVIKLPLRGT